MHDSLHERIRNLYSRQFSSLEGHYQQAPIAIELLPIDQVATAVAPAYRSMDRRATTPS